MTGHAATGDIWEVMSTARTNRRFTDEPVDEATLTRCLEAATWAPSGANAQGWRFVVLRSPEQRAVVAKAAAQALQVIEPVYGMTRPAEGDNSQRARTHRATSELHDRAGEFISVLFAQQRFPAASELLLGGSIFPAMQNLLLAARAQGLGGLHDQLGVVRGRNVVARSSRCTRRLDACRAHRGRLAEGQARTAPASAAGRGPPTSTTGMRLASRA